MSPFIVSSGKCKGCFITMSPLKIISINIHGLIIKQNKKRVATHLTKLAQDIILLQETHLCNDSNLILNSKKYPTQFHVAGSSKARGVIFFKDIRFSLKDRTQDERGRFLFLKGVGRRDGSHGLYICT